MAVSFKAKDLKSATRIMCLFFFCFFGKTHKQDLLHCLLEHSIHINTKEQLHPIMCKCKEIITIVIWTLEYKIF